MNCNIASNKRMKRTKTEKNIYFCEGQAQGLRKDER
jgi:hypothetical protein